MPDRITANLPARDCGEMRAFFERLGFSMEFCSESWLIKARGPLELEFFLEPATSACVPSATSTACSAPRCAVWARDETRGWHHG
ncbi:MAG: hypothetical protein MUC96_24960 [Myxococcaceae bacterium]|jgi:hypothetical protein|nr:hypothetical protein [Myxococcaceae bacterium]